MRIILFLYLVLIGWVAREIYNAPEGYEDERGFHYVKQQEEVCDETI